MPILEPYEDWPLFKSIEEAFVKEFGELPGVEKVFCGVGSGLGPLNAITVSSNKGAQRIKLPKYFMGFPVVREYLLVKLERFSTMVKFRKLQARAHNRLLLAILITDD